MLNNFKNILIGIFALIIMIAISASACTASPSPATTPASTPDTNANHGNGNGSNTSISTSVNVNSNQVTNGQGNTSASMPGTPQANITSASTVHGIVSSYDLTGMSLILDDGTSLYIQLGSPRYSQSIGFAPAVGEGVVVNGFPGDQELYCAISVTLDSTGLTYTFRDEDGRPLWAEGGGNGQGGRP